MMVEVQALTNATSFGQPRRVANGVDFARLLMIAAVLSRRAGIKLGNQDIIVNATAALNWMNRPPIWVSHFQLLQVSATFQ